MAFLLVPVGAALCAVADKYQVGHNPTSGSLGGHIRDAFDVRKVEAGQVRGLLSDLHPMAERVEGFALEAFAHCMSGVGRAFYQVEWAVDHLSGNYERGQQEVAKAKAHLKEREEELQREAVVLQACDVVLGRAKEAHDQRALLLTEGQRVAVRIDAAVKLLPPLPSVEEVQAALDQFAARFTASFPKMEELVNYEANIEEDLDRASYLECELTYLEAEYERLVAREESLNAALGTTVDTVTATTDTLEQVLRPQPTGVQSRAAAAPAVVEVSA
jgi:predicted  nucleic acid-binding Zn-ribbon protein